MDDDDEPAEVAAFLAATAARWNELRPARPKPRLVWPPQGEDEPEARD